MNVIVKYRNWTANILLPVLALMLAIPLPASAETSEGFMKSLSGSWRGKGTVSISKKSKITPIRCKVTSRLNQIGKTLHNKGRCATAQRKIRISGTIGYSAKGNKVSGSYLGSFGDIVVTASSGVVKGNQLTLNTTFNSKSVSKVSRSRNVIRRISSRKFTVTLYEKDGGSYKYRGKITFSK